MPEESFYRMRIFIFTLVLAVFFPSCHEEETLPIPPEKLAVVLRDVHLAESAILHLLEKEKDSVLNVYYEQICQIHEVSRADLDSSIAILKREPAIAFPEYEKVMEELEKLDLQQD